MLFAECVKEVLKAAYPDDGLVIRYAQCRLANDGYDTFYTSAKCQILRFCRAKVVATGAENGTVLIAFERDGKIVT